MMRILAADIGGTNSRFAVFEIDETSTRLHCKRKTWLKTHDANSFEELLTHLSQSELRVSIKDFNAVVMAIPGAVEQNTRASLANVPWTIDVSPLREKYPGQPIHLINDFVAQAFACRTPGGQTLMQIKHGTIDPAGTVGVIGAGTGLGHCALIPDGRGGWLAVPSEAGHAVSYFKAGKERAYHDFLLEQTGAPYPYGDLVVTGRGLSFVHQFLSGEKLNSEAVAEIIAPDSETTAWFARFYGRAARNYAISVVALGGIYITGGIAAGNPMFVTHSAFIDEFLEAPAHRELLEDVPIFLNQNEDSGLWGAAFFGLLNIRNEEN